MSIMSLSKLTSVPVAAVRPETIYRQGCIYGYFRGFEATAGFVAVHA